MDSRKKRLYLLPTLFFLYYIDYQCFTNTPNGHFFSKCSIFWYYVQYFVHLQHINRTMEEINPFVREQSIEAYLITRKRSLLKGDSQANDYYLPGGDINIKDLIDRSNKVNIYMTPETRKIYMLLSESSHKLTRYVEGILKYNQDIVKINVNKFMNEGMIRSRTTAYKAIEELCRYGFITPYHKRQYYWINPFMFFNGNRLTKYPENVKLD